MKTFIGLMLALTTTATLAAPRKPADKIKRIVCTLENTTKPTKSINATLLVGKAEYGVTTESLSFRGGAYSFYFTIGDGLLYGTLDENNIVQDEVGSFGCHLQGVKPGTKFCEEPITTSPLDNEESDEQLHAFNFFCVGFSK